MKNKWILFHFMSQKVVEVGSLGRKPILTVAFLTLALMNAGCRDQVTEGQVDRPPAFNHELIDSQGPLAPWGKAVGDINGDGLPDVVIGGHRPPPHSLIKRVGETLTLNDSITASGELVWYENPGWERRRISTDFSVRTDVEVADINNDQRNDLVIVADQGLFWLRNEDWAAFRVSDEILHDVEVADLDLDGDLDIVARNQSLFGYKNADQVLVFRQDDESTWVRIVLKVPHGEGLKVGDMNGDGLQDIVANRVWLSNPGTLSPDIPWQSVSYTQSSGAPSQRWEWDDVFIDLGDIDGDGRMDVLLSPAEEAGEFYEIAWFQAPARTGERWTKHTIDPNVEAVHHFVAARDVDLDGDLDVLTAEMNQGEGENPVKLYVNENGTWRKQIIDGRASHSMRAVDIDGDFDVDLIGANWQFADFDRPYSISLWRNSLPSVTDWKRHVIDPDRPGQAVFIFSGDLDNDGYSDLVTGAYWYKNPGKIAETWSRHKLGEAANNVASLSDFDGDGDIDFLASGWLGYGQRSTLIESTLNALSLKTPDRSYQGSQFVWGENDGRGNFKIHQNVESGQGDFLQGSAQLAAQSSSKILLSWHSPGEGIQALVVPAKPKNHPWIWHKLSDVSQDEAISVADLDADGSDDIVLGTRWLRQSEEEIWSEHIIDPGPGKPDRHQVVDLNGDGRLDVVVGFEAVSREGEVAWYEQSVTTGIGWVKHTVARVVGPMSLDVADMDDDGDSDVIVGEHNLKTPEHARMLWFENLDGSASSWRGHLIHQGDEHHDGALTVDIDNDGDLDVISIGWGHGKVLVYENQGSVRGRE